jgi:hypothetical protein
VVFEKLNESKQFLICMYVLPHNKILLSTDFTEMVSSAMDYHIQCSL